MKLLFPCFGSSGKMGIVMQIFMLVGLVTSTAIFTQFAVMRIGFGNTELECRRVVSTPVCLSCSSRKSLDDDQTLDAYQAALDSNFELHGYVVSAVEEKYNFTRTALEKLNLTPHRYVPMSYKSPTVDKAMQEYNKGSREHHHDIKNLKMFSNRMAHTHLLHKFVNDKNAKINSWRFFFEDDIALHPLVTQSMAAEALLKGMELGSADGAIYLGICGPADSYENKTLIPGVIASKSYGFCSHAYGFTQWRAAGILSHLDKLDVDSKAKMWFDVLLQSYGSTVTKFWVLGANLRTPIPDLNHFGLLYQDRNRYPSFVNTYSGSEESSSIEKSRI